VRVRVKISYRDKQLRESKEGKMILSIEKRRDIQQSSNGLRISGLPQLDVLMDAGVCSGEK
jgi:hypothetical protein